MPITLGAHSGDRAVGATQTKLRTGQIAQAAFVIAFMVLLGVGALSYRVIIVSGESSRWLEHTRDVLKTINLTHLSMEFMASSVRGFAITGNESYFAIYRAEILALKRHVADLRALTADNPEQLRRVSRLEKLADERIARAAKVVGLRRDRGVEAAADEIRKGPGSRITGNFQQIVSAMQGEEARLFTLRDAEAKKDLSQTKVILFAGTLLGLLITGAAGSIVQRDGAKRGLAEQALRDSEEQYRTLVQVIQDYAIFMLDPQGRIVTWNAGAERIKGYSAEEIVGHNYSRFFTPEDIKRGRPEEILRMAAATGRHEEQAMRVRRDGSQFLANVTIIALRDPVGKLRGFSKITRDLSEIRESEAKYRGLMEAAPDAMVVVNAEGEIVLLNVQAEKQFGYRRDELLGQKVTNIIPDGFAERLIADDLRSVEDALAQQIGTGIELTALRKDGSEFPIEIMLSPLDSVEGTLVTAAIRNIGVRKAAEKHLAAMEGRYRGLLEAAPDAMVVVNKGGEIVLLNVQAEKQFGYRRDELLGQKVTNIIPVGFAERLIADDLRSTEDALAQQIGTGLELIALRKDGSEFPIELMLSPLESAEGTLVTAAIRNISVRKKADEHLVQMEGRYRGLLEAAPDAMVVVNQGGEIVLLNVQAEKQFGYRRDELLGQKVTDIIPKGFAERLIADDLRSAEDALTQQIGTGIELTALRKDGSEFSIEMMLSPLESPEGILVTAAIRDTSARKKMERLKDEFIASVSHELRTPLTSISASLGLLMVKMTSGLPAPVMHLISIAHLNSQRLVRLVNDILDIEKMEARQTVFNFERVEVRQQVEEAIEANLGFAVAREVRILFDKNAGVAADVRADPGRLTQVITNLLSNAVKFSPRNGEVEVSVERISSNVRISVCDHGLGIAADFESRIFERFAQADVNDARLRGGTGLGLSIVKQIVDRLDGKVSFTDASGGGTIFHVDLPCWKGEANFVKDPEAQLAALKEIHIELGRDTAAARGKPNGLMLKQG